MVSLEEAVRQNVARHDHVIPFEPMTLAVLAVADATGAKAMRKRLLELCAGWCDANGGAGTAAFGIGTATFPQDGATTTAMVQCAKARAAEDRSSRRGAHTGAGPAA